MGETQFDNEKLFLAKLDIRRHNSRSYRLSGGSLSSGFLANQALVFQYYQACITGQWGSFGVDVIWSPSSKYPWLLSMNSRLWSAKHKVKLSVGRYVFSLLFLLCLLRC